uniref:SPRY domain-containing protein n=1 Tax=Panagrolaimus sp. JU765 TaxID=591449 RepID=A0AC34Q6Y2_9BILA
MSEASEDDHNQRKKRKLNNSSENISPHEHPDSQLVSHQSPSVSLLQRASSLFENISKAEPLIIQEELEEDYAHVKNEVVSPEFYGEPVPDDEDNDNLFELHAGFPKRKTEVPKDDEIPAVEGKLELDFYNADLNIKPNKANKWSVIPDNSAGFALMMSEIRTNYGVVVGRATSRIAFQGCIKSYLPIKHLPFEEMNPYICQIGWSTMKYSNGDQVKVYGYCSTGKKFVGGDFQAFGEGFGLNDVITTILDMEQMEIVYYKNEKCLGKLFPGKELFEVGDVVFPYFSTKNCELLANLGVEEPKNDGENIWK